MAVSANGFVARGPEDDMSWTGKLDKNIFRLLTSLSSEPLFAGKRTFNQMPPLPGRVVFPLSFEDRTCYDLKTAQFNHPSSWLIGGQTVALEALRLGMLDEVVLCKNSVWLKSGIKLDTRLPNFGNFINEIKFKDGDEAVSVMILRK